MNPLKMENLAVYPRRRGTNRTNAYTKPGNFTKLAKGLPSFETRHCNRAVPSDSPLNCQLARENGADVSAE